jgi:hypothetical protein
VWGRPGSDLVIRLFRSGLVRQALSFGGCVNAQTCRHDAGRVLSGVPKTDGAIPADPSYQSHVRNFLQMRCVRRYDVTCGQGAGRRARQPPRCRGAMRSRLPRLRQTKERPRARRGSRARGVAGRHGAARAAAAVWPQPRGFAGPHNYPRAANAKPMAIVPQHMPATKTSRTIANVIAHPPSKRGS